MHAWMQVCTWRYKIGEWGNALHNFRWKYREVTLGLRGLDWAGLGCTGLLSQVANADLLSLGGLGRGDTRIVPGDRNRAVLETEEVDLKGKGIGKEGL